MTTAQTTTPTVRPLPTHIDSVMKDADEMGYDVDRLPTSVKITPPKGSGVKSFTMSLNPPPSPPQVTKTLSDIGFLKARAAWEREQGIAPTPAQPAAKEPKLLVCQECKEAGAEKPFTTEHPQGLGAHRRSAHGVVSTKPNTVAKRAKRAAAKETPAKKTAAKKTAAKKTAAKTTAKAAPAPVPAPRPAAEQPAITGELPTRVAEALGVFLRTVEDETSGAQLLRDEVKQLRAFRDEVLAEASDGTKPPVQALAHIITLAEKTQQQ